MKKEVAKDRQIRHGQWVQGLNPATHRHSGRHGRVQGLREEKWKRRERDVLWEERAKAVSIQHGLLSISYPRE